MHAAAEDPQRPAVMFVARRSRFGQSWLEAVATATRVTSATFDEASQEPLAVRPLKLPLRRWSWPAEAELLGRRVSRSVRGAGVHPKLLHSHSYGWSAAMPTAAARLKVPFVITEHSSWLSGANPDPAKRVTAPGRRMARYVFSVADRVIAVSGHLADTIAALGVDGDKITVIGNPVDTAQFRPCATTGDGTETVIASVNRLSVEKGVDVLLTALSRLDTRRAWRLELVGTGPAACELAALAYTLGIRDRVTFRGHLPREATLGALQSADVYCSPSRTETFGLAAVEALACGLPTITTAAGALRELADAPAMVQTRVDDVDGLAAALREAIDGQIDHDPEAQWRWVDERFSPRVVGAKTARVYGEIA
jgi:glycosyltransferase involved in cell wall biosynthesis